MKTIKADYCIIKDYWDYPLDGFIRTKGYYLYFSADFGDGYNPVYYKLYMITDKELRVRTLMESRRFRHMVGWHWEYKKGENRGRFNPASKPNWEDYYKLENRSVNHEKLKNSIKTVGTYIGKTYDLRTLKINNEFYNKYFLPKCMLCKGEGVKMTFKVIHNRKTIKNSEWKLNTCPLCKGSKRSDNEIYKSVFNADV